MRGFCLVEEKRTLFFIAFRFNCLQQNDRAQAPTNERRKEERTEKFNIWLIRFDMFSPNFNFIQSMDAAASSKCICDEPHFDLLTVWRIHSD